MKLQLYFRLDISIVFDVNLLSSESVKIIKQLPENLWVNLLF